MTVQAAFPAQWVRQSKFWPAVNRVDDVYGDRHLVSVIQVLLLFSFRKCRLML